MLGGASIGFAVLSPDGESWRSGLRTVRTAVLVEISLVASPAYPTSVTARTEASARPVARPARHGASRSTVGVAGEGRWVRDPWDDLHRWEPKEERRQRQRDAQLFA